MVPRNSNSNTIYHPTFARTVQRNKKIRTVESTGRRQHRPADPDGVVVVIFRNHHRELELDPACSDGDNVMTKKTREKENI